LALALPLTAHGVGEAEIGKELVWQSRNENFRQLPREFGDLYRDLITLRDAGHTVKTLPIKVARGQPISEALASKNLYDGPSMPIQLSVFACGFNPKVCTATPGKSGLLSADDAKTDWKIRPGAKIQVPDIHFEAVVVHKLYTKKAADSLKKIVVDDRHGCEHYDEACNRYVQNLNRRLDPPLHDRTAGEILVPTKAWRGVITFEQPVAAAPQVPVPSPAAAASAIQRSIAEVITVAPGLTKRIVSPVIMKPSAAASSDSASSDGVRKLILQLINHPLAEATSLTMPTGAHASAVAVFDSRVDVKHCMLVKVSEPDSDVATSDSGRATQCGESGRALEKDHGTHVVGLISSKVESSLGPGVNPYASVPTFSINKDNFVDPKYVAKQVERLRKLYETTPPDVVNLSFEYSPPAASDALLAAISDLQTETLFVVSAGNQGWELSSGGECAVRPACRDSSNIVVVAALDLNSKAPELFKTQEDASNFGDRVHLSAPGLNIVSTLMGDRVGPMTGTSQAAPIVAGAASLLYMYQHRLRPWEVRHRLIYTSDLFAGLYSKMQGGRLNVKRLLAFKDEAIDTISGKHFEGRSLNAGIVLKLKDLESNGKPLNVPFEQVRRLAWDATNNKYVLFRVKAAKDKQPPILERRIVGLTQPDKELSFSVAGIGGTDRVATVATRDLRDYVAALQP